MLRRILLALALPLFLAACGADHRWASDDAVRQAAYRSPEPPSISLVTVMGSVRHEGAHTALLINGSQRVIFDPAGSFVHPHVPERLDVLYGITPELRNVYLDYHARDLPGEHYYVVLDTVPVSLAAADAAIRAAQENGAANKAFCANATGAVLRQVPGFESAPRTFAPLRMRAWFRRLPGVQSMEFRDGDGRLKHSAVLRMKDGSLETYDR